MTGEDLPTRLAPLTEFMGVAPLTDAIAALEKAMDGRKAEDVPSVLADAGVSIDLLSSAFYARARFGRVNDVIHATAIALALPHLLEPNESLKRPSLAAGNDPSRPFDVETDRRVAEFKLARWDGHDAGRKRQLFKDLVHLAAADVEGRVAELYVLGTRPAQFLNETTATAAWALNRMADKTKRMFEDRFGSMLVPIPTFVNGPAAHVRIIDLEQVVPELFTPQVFKLGRDGS